MGCFIGQYQKTVISGLTVVSLGVNVAHLGALFLDELFNNRIIFFWRDGACAVNDPAARLDRLPSGGQQRVQQGDRAVHEQKTKQKKLSAELMS